jgi:plasmid stabilization system protein ParE
MKYRVIFQPRALRELEEQYLYVAERSPDVAARWFNRFVSAIEGIASGPERYSVAREASLVGREIRQLLFGKGRGVRRALFVVERDIVRILSIRHSAQQDLTAEELLGEL